MAIRISVSTEGKSKQEMIVRTLSLSLLALLLVIGGSISCKKKAGEKMALGEEGLVAKEGIIEFEGVVNVGVGRYLFIPEASGFDIIVQGPLESGDASTLVGKEVRGKGAFSPERPSILIANDIEVKESGRNWMSIFIRTEEFVMDDYLDLEARNEFHVIKTLSFDKKEGWEGIEKAKIYGKLETETVTEGEEEKEIFRIIVLDEKDNEVGSIIVDNFTDFSQYYIKKLRFFDKLWFYFTVKDTVEWRVRRRTRELFHADVLFNGLF
ncbi:MAG: hypothetical protein GTN73_01265 [Candidatus Aminicenantes bacterium]|nr:hypothetical protein [Candidatus Aminicenantes bacterium]